MKKIILVLIVLILTVQSYGQAEKVITYPLNLLYNTYLKECLEPYNVSLKEIESYQNTFIATLDFVERFKNSCDPILFDFYAQNNKALWEIDLEVAAYYDSLSTVYRTTELKADLGLKEETENSYLILSKKFKNFYSLLKGELIVINYSSINNKSKRLISDLEKIGLRREEADNYIRLLKKN